MTHSGLPFFDLKSHAIPSVCTTYMRWGSRGSRLNIVSSLVFVTLCLPVNASSSLTILYRVAPAKFFNPNRGAEVRSVTYDLAHDKAPCAGSLTKGTTRNVHIYCINIIIKKTFKNNCASGVFLLLLTSVSERCRVVVALTNQCPSVPCYRQAMWVGSSERLFHWFIQGSNFRSVWNMTKVVGINVSRVWDLSWMRWAIWIVTCLSGCIEHFERDH